MIPRGGSISYNGQYGDVPHERGTFLRLEVYKEGNLAFLLFQRAMRRDSGCRRWAAGGS